MSIIKNRHELLFVYDVKEGNPNGDPMDSNKPRLDEKTGHNIVTDVRLKRTIRDDLVIRGETIFVAGEAETSDKRAEFLIGDLSSYEKNREKASQALLEKCIDLRLFGGTIPLKGLNMSLTGPVQFRFGRSLHVVDPSFMQGTAAFATAGKEQRSFREEWLLHYSALAFYGVINQNAAKWTLLTDEDVQKFLISLWEGTKDLITRSKMEQLPRLLLDVVYRDGLNFHVGELDKALKLVSEKPENEIREVNDYVIEVGQLALLLDQVSDKIERIRYRYDPRLKLTMNSTEVSPAELLPEKTEALPA